LNAEAMLLLTKAPERFDVQFCKIQGVRAELFDKLIALLQIDRSRDHEIELLDVVKRLCVFVADLPPYVRNTSKLSSTTLLVRNAILSAREPATLLFTNLPKACGFNPITAKRTDEKRAAEFIETNNDETYETEKNSAEDETGMEDAPRNLVSRKARKVGKSVFVVGARWLRGGSRIVPRFHHSCSSVDRGREARTTREKSRVLVPARRALSRRYFT
jgi:hypothetical protein